MTRRSRLLVACLAVGWALPAAAADLVVSAAASLSNALRDIGRRFDAAHPGDTVVFNFAASDVLLAQIDKGAPADVFASADEETMDRAARNGRIDATSRRDFAANTLVIIVPKGAPAIASIQALATDRVRHVALGSPESVPAGRYAREVLQQSGAWAAIEPKVVRAQNVRQVLDYVARGEAEAGFVYRTDAALMPDRVAVTAEPPAQRRVRYPIAVVADTRNRALADAFTRYVEGEEAQGILRRYGFLAP